MLHLLSGCDIAKNVALCFIYYPVCKYCQALSTLILLTDTTILEKASNVSTCNLTQLIFQHTVDFITHGFSAGIAEMDAHLVGGLADFLYQRGGRPPAL